MAIMITSWMIKLKQLSSRVGRSRLPAAWRSKAIRFTLIRSKKRQKASLRIHPGQARGGHPRLTIKSIQTRVSGHGVGCGSRMWNQLLIYSARYVRVPIPGSLGKAHNSEEDHCDPGSHSPWRKLFLLRKQHGYCGKSHLQCILRRTGDHTFHAARTFGRLNAHEFVDGERRRAGLRAFSTVDAS